MRSFFRFWAPLCLLSLACCASRTGGSTTTANKVVDMESLRIVAKHDEQGRYTFESYDAEELFRKANSELDAGRCREAVQLYDRLREEFVASRFVSASLYNAGLCLAQLDDKEAALLRFATLIDELPDSPDVKHATFQATHLDVALERWDEAMKRADALLARTDLEPAERVEAMASRAQALLGKHQLDEAERQAKQTLSFYRTRPPEVMPDEYFAAAANFVVAEAIRLRGEDMPFPDTTQEEQKAVLVQKAQLLLDAQREYFNTIRFTNAHWAAAAGHRIGAMYDTLWHAIMAAPVPATLSAGATEMYPQELAKLIKPLLRHAIRYWELTLMMVERTGVRTEWADLTRKDLERTRALLLEQPPGVGGLPPTPPPTASSAAPVNAAPAPPVSLNPASTPSAAGAPPSPPAPEARPPLAGPTHPAEIAPPVPPSMQMPDKNAPSTGQLPAAP